MDGAARRPGIGSVHLLFRRCAGIKRLGALGEDAAGGHGLRRRLYRMARLCRRRRRSPGICAVLGKRGASGCALGPGGITAGGCPPPDAHRTGEPVSPGPGLRLPGFWYGAGFRPGRSVGWSAAFSPGGAGGGQPAFVGVRPGGQGFLEPLAGRQRPRPSLPPWPSPWERSWAPGRY